MGGSSRPPCEQGLLQRVRGDGGDRGKADRPDAWPTGCLPWLALGLGDSELTSGRSVPEYNAPERNERESECVCVCVRESECVCVCVCV